MRIERSAPIVFVEIKAIGALLTDVVDELLAVWIGQTGNALSVFELVAIVALGTGTVGGIVCCAKLVDELALLSRIQEISWRTFQATVIDVKLFASRVPFGCWPGWGLRLWTHCITYSGRLRLTGLNGIRRRSGHDQCGWLGLYWLRCSRLNNNDC